MKNGECNISKVSRKNIACAEPKFQVYYSKSKTKKSFFVVYLFLSLEWHWEMILDWPCGGMEFCCLISAFRVMWRRMESWLSSLPLLGSFIGKTWPFLSRLKRMTIDYCRMTNKKDHYCVLTTDIILLPN